MHRARVHQRVRCKELTHALHIWGGGTRRLLNMGRLLNRLLITYFEEVER